MDHDSLYETDICTWAEQQAAALRSLASRSDLPNALDLENVVEEIESVGRGYLIEIRAAIQQVLTQAILLAADPNSSDAPNWSDLAITRHADLVQHYQKGARGRIDMEHLWRRAAGVSLQRLGAFRRDAPTELVRARLNVSCPVSVDEICDQNFEFRTVIARVQQFFAAQVPA